MSLHDPVSQAIREARTIAVVGLSSNPARPSHGVARYLQHQGYRIVPINPRETTVLGEPAFADLLQARTIVGPIDIVDVFRRGQHVPAIAAEAQRIGARMLWLQEGVSNPEAEAQARAAGMLVVSDRCLLKAHVKLTNAPEGTR